MSVYKMSLLIISERKVISAQDVEPDLLCELGASVVTSDIIMTL